MLKLSTEKQIELLSAAWKLADTLRALAPEDLESLAAAGVIATAVFPTFEELAQASPALGLPVVTRERYDELRRDAARAAALANLQEH
jgi:hypothetical protein